MNDCIKKIGLHEQVAAALRREILNSEPGRQLDPIPVLTKRFSLSANTVRNALLLLSQEGLVDLRQGKGCFVRDQKSSKHVGILIELDISRPGASYFYLRMAQQLRSFFTEAGFRNHLYVGHYQPGEKQVDSEQPCREFLEAAAGHKFCGVAKVGMDSHPTWARSLEEEHVPIVGGAEHYRFGVGINFTEMLREGVRFLCREGRRKIAVMGWRDPSETDFDIRMLAEMAKELGFTFHKEWIRMDLFPGQPGAGWDEFREIWAGRTEKPDGLLIADDMLCRDAAGAILELGICAPEQLLVVSHANKGSGVTVPFPVVCLEYDPDEYARAMGEMLVRLMKREAPPEPKVYLSFRWTKMDGNRRPPEPICEGNPAVDGGNVAECVARGDAPPEI